MPVAIEGASKRPARNATKGAEFILVFWFHIQFFFFFFSFFSYLDWTYKPHPSYDHLDTSTLRTSSKNSKMFLFLFVCNSSTEACRTISGKIFGTTWRHSIPLCSTSEQQSTLPWTTLSFTLINQITLSLSLT